MNLQEVLDELDVFRKITRIRLQDIYNLMLAKGWTLGSAQGLKFTVTGVENLPRTGGAVIAINHTSYFDFTFAGLPAYKQHLGRKVRFMAKKEVFDSKVSDALEPEDIARVVMFALSQPDRVDINEVLVRPVKQSG